MDFPNLDNYNKLFHERDQQLQLLLHRSSQEAADALECSRESLELLQKLYQNLSQLKVVAATDSNDDNPEQPRCIQQIKDTVLRVSRQCQLARDEAREAMEEKKKAKSALEFQVCELKKELERIQQENQQMEAQLADNKSLPLVLQLMSSSLVAGAKN